MNKKTAIKWNEIRKDGLIRYIAKKGLLYWGLPMCGAVVGMQTVQNPERFLFFLMINIPIWIVLGTIFSLISWYTFERKFQNFLIEAGGIKNITS